MDLIIAANWKMHKTTAETIEYCQAIRKDEELFKGLELLVCPPFTALPAAAQILKGSPIKLGAQDMHWEQKGAFTGEVSSAMLLDLGVEYVIIGHSERRHLLGESDLWVNQKMKAALTSGIKPILCVGETEAEREQSITEEVLKRQLSSALKELQAETVKSLVVAYEPVWAIGTGKAASPGDAENASAYIRTIVKDIFGKDTGDSLFIQYGGSVNEDNIGLFAVLPSVQGVLVGGASLKADTFSALIQAARKAVES